MNSSRPTRLMTLAVLSALACLGGCGKKVSDLASSLKETASSVAGKAEEAAKNVAQSAQNITGKAGEALDLAGSMELTLDAPLRTSGCYAKFIVSQAGRGNVLQLQSYRDASQESFPSAMIRAPVSAAKLAELQGQTVAAQLYVQAKEEGPAWSTQQELVQLKITAVDEKTVSAELVSGTLQNAASGASQPVKGVFKGVL